jgi:L-lactate dehydrogenase complex protein LldG
MSSRARLLAALRAQSLEKVPLPALSGNWIEYPDPLEQFRMALTRAAGSVLCVARSELRARLAELPLVREARRCLSLVPELAGNINAPEEPQAYADLDLLVVAAAFGVAENGALWIDEHALPVRAGLFLTQHLIVLLERSTLVHNMHGAYARLGADVGRTGYGCFISGPSKTADIEQALVVGAHGPRSLTALLY